MILDFNIFSNTRFQIGGKVYPRVYRVRKGKGGISLIHLKTGEKLYRNLSSDDILIAGYPMESLPELQKIVYNLECLCDADSPEPKIFDLHFAKEFE